MITGKKGIAKVSGSPGKTRSINHFKIESSRTSHQLFEWMLVDLPGYGYAKLPKTEREKFGSMIRNYLLKRETLALTFLLIDSRLSPQKNDIEFLNWLGENETGFVIVFTKTDKLSASELNSTISEWKTILSLEWQEFPAMIFSSSSKNKGRTEILEIIDKALEDIYLNSSNR